MAALVRLVGVLEVRWRVVDTALTRDELDIVACENQ